MICQMYEIFTLPARGGTSVMSFVRSTSFTPPPCETGTGKNCWKWLIKAALRCGGKARARYSKKRREYEKACPRGEDDRPSPETLWHNKTSQYSGRDDNITCPETNPYPINGSLIQGTQTDHLRSKNVSYRLEISQPLFGVIPPNRSKFHCVELVTRYSWRIHGTM